MDHLDWENFFRLHPYALYSIEYKEHFVEWVTGEADRNMCWMIGGAYSTVIRD